MLLAVLALTACHADTDHAAPQASTAKAQPAPPAGAPRNADAPPGRLVYNPKTDEMLFVFDDLGTALTIPHAWQEGDVSIEKLSIAGDTSPGMRAYGARFHPIHEDARAQFHVALIRVYDEVRWQDLAGEERGSEIELGHAGGKVYSYAIAQLNPLPPGSAESARFDQLVIPYQDARRQLMIRMP